jgi:hypothetical protein
MYPTNFTHIYDNIGKNNDIWKRYLLTIDYKIGGKKWEKYSLAILRRTRISLPD